MAPKLCIWPLRPPFISILAATSDDIRKRAFRIMDSGYFHRYGVPGILNDNSKFI